MSSPAAMPVRVPAASRSARAASRIFSASVASVRNVQTVGVSSVALGAHQQPYLVQHIAGQSMQQNREEGPVGRGKPNLRTKQVPFENRDLVTQDQDLHIVGPVTHRQQ